jgi:hypothetical protein
MKDRQTESDAAAAHAASLLRRSTQPRLVALFASRSHVASLCAAGARTPVRCTVLLCAAGVGGAAVETFQLPAAASFQSETKDYQQPAHTTLPTGNQTRAERTQLIGAK